MGFGAVILIYIFEFIKNDIKRVIVVSVIAGSMVEYILSFMLEAIYGNRFWDYHYLDFNLNGRICLQYTIYWMFAGILIMKVIKPLVDKLINKIPEKKILDIAIFSFLVIDALITVWGVNVYTNRAIERYNNTYVQNTKNDLVSNIENKFFNDESITKVFPNIRITGANGEEIYARDLK